MLYSKHLATKKGTKRAPKNKKNRCCTAIRLGKTAIHVRPAVVTFCNQPKNVLSFTKRQRKPGFIILCCLHAIHPLAFAKTHKSFDLRLLNPLLNLWVKMIWRLRFALSGRIFPFKDHNSSSICFCQPHQYIMHSKGYLLAHFFFT